MKKGWWGWRDIAVVNVQERMGEGKESEESIGGSFLEDNISESKVTNPPASFPHCCFQRSLNSGPSLHLKAKPVTPQRSSLYWLVH